MDGLVVCYAHIFCWDLEVVGGFLDDIFRITTILDI